MAVYLIFFGHLQFVGGDEVEGGVEVAHGHQERVYGTSVFQVAYEEDVQVLQRALRLVDGVEVEHGLRGVLVGSVAGVHDGHVGHLAGIAGGSLQVVAHHDDVGIVAHHLDGILQRLALRRAGSLGVAEADDACAQAVGRRLEAEACARRGFEK